jgi:uncharacterized iron-regulated membrane protein
MSAWQRWLYKPRTTWLRKAFFQVHLWIGVAIGLYIVMLSLTGSALVFRRELVQVVGPAQPPVDRTAQVLSESELGAAATRAYPGHAVTRIGAVQRRSPVSEIWLERDGQKIERVFHAYTGEDLGDPFPPGLRAMVWLANLHDDLLMGRGHGRFWNGIGSVLVTVLCITGACIWWPGARLWRRGMSVRWRAGWPRLNFDLHSALGFWFFLILAVWAVSGIYMSFPDPFTTAVDRVWGTDAEYGTRAGDVALEWLVRLHFGRWRSHTLKAVWVLMGLVPTFLFITGAAMWWRRVVVRRRSAASRPVVGIAAEPQTAE